MGVWRSAPRWIGVLAMTALVATCAPSATVQTRGPDQMSPGVAGSPSATTDGSPPTASQPEVVPPSAAPPTRAPDAVTAADAQVALVPVVGFWSTRAGISSAQLRAVLSGTSKVWRRVLVAGPAGSAGSAGPLAGATQATAATVRTAVNADARTLGLLAAGDVTADVRALALDGRDLFGNHRERDLAAWPLLVAAPAGAPTPGFDPATTWTLVAAGDVMLDRTVYQRTVLQHKGADYPWNGGTARITGYRCCTSAGGRLPNVKRTGHGGAVRALFKDADIALVNLEGPVVRRFRWHPKGLTFTFKPALLSGLKHAGIDVVTIGNNHIANAGRSGVTETARHLDEVGIAHVGAGRNLAAARAPAWFDVAGQRVAILGYDGIRPALDATSKRAGSARLISSLYRTDVKAARATGADAVIVLPHWGVEYTGRPTATQRVHARKLMAAGTSLILGSHSHWAGAMETIGGQRVFYSLGNFIFDLTRSAETVEGLIVEVTFRGATPVQIRLHPTVQVDLVQPNLLVGADGATVIARMQRASKALLAH